MPHHIRSKKVKVVGVGEVGRNALDGIVKSRALPGGLLELISEFGCVHCGPAPQWWFDALNAARPGRPLVQSLSLHPIDFGSNADAARDAALRNQAALCAIIADADMVFLLARAENVADIAVISLLAKWAREASAFTVALLTTPFDWQSGIVNMTAVAEAAIVQLTPEVDVLASFSNQQLAHELPEDISIDGFFTVQYQRIGARISDLIHAKNANAQGALERDGLQPPVDLYSP